MRSYPSASTQQYIEQDGKEPNCHQYALFLKSLMNFRDLIPKVPSISIAIGTKLLYREKLSALYLAIFYSQLPGLPQNLGKLQQLHNNYFP